jgi:Tfp pilus assembly PilM family ATPase
LDESVTEPKARTATRLPVDFTRIYGGRGIIAVDLGHRRTKAVHIQRQGQNWTLTKSVILPSPLAAGGLKARDLAQHLAEIRHQLKAQTRRVIIALPAREAVLRVAEMPDAPAADLRAVLRYNSVKYLQQELKDHVFDCVVLDAEPPAQAEARTSTPRAAVEADFGDGKVRVHGEQAPAGRRKLVLVGGMPRSPLAEINAAATEAGLKLEGVTLSQVALTLAGKAAMPDMIGRGVHGFLDIGHDQSTLVILARGEPVFIRVIATGAAAILRSLAVSLNITPQVAEGLIMTMPEKVREKLVKAAFPLVEELRASVDFFEDRWQQTVMRIFVTGAESKSDVVVEILRDELGAPLCERWEPAAFVSPLPGENPELGGRDALPFAGAIGAAVAALEPDSACINLVAEQLEAEESKRRDPVRWTLVAAACVAVLLLAAGGWLHFKTRALRQEVERAKEHSGSLEGVASTVTKYSTQAREHEAVLTALGKQAAGRFLWALPLNALQTTMVEGVQVTRLQLSQSSSYTEEVKPEKDIDGKVYPGQPAFTVDKNTLTISARDYGEGEAHAREGFIQTLGQEPFFRANLRPVNPIRLVDLQPRHVDLGGSSQPYIPFTIECAFKERKVVNE